MRPDLILHGERVTLRPSRPADVAALVEMLSEPEVVRWWRTTTAEDVLEELHLGLTVLVGDVVSGWLLVHEESEPDYRHVALDIAMTTALRGEGHGREALALIVGHCIAEGHHRFTIDPNAENERAIRSYAAIGFKPVGILREQELGADAIWHDALFMDLLAREFVPPHHTAET